MEFDLDEGKAWEAKKRIGDYVLVIDESYRLWKVGKRVSGAPIPAELSGKWTEPSEFEEALASYSKRIGAPQPEASR